jgi:hypothetical protein
LRGQKQLKESMEGHKDKVKEGEYEGRTMYSWMKMEQ